MHHAERQPRHSGMADPYGGRFAHTNVGARCICRERVEPSIAGGTAARRPGLVVAVTNYPNPFPQAEDVDEIAELCTPLIDAIPTCLTGWWPLAGLTCRGHSEPIGLRTSSLEDRPVV